MTKPTRGKKRKRKDAGNRHVFKHGFGEVTRHGSQDESLPSVFATCWPGVFSGVTNHYIGTSGGCCVHGTTALLGNVKTYCGYAASCCS